MKNTMSTIQLGNKGEYIAKTILLELGFRPFPKGVQFDKIKQGKPSWDLLMGRWGVNYAINVKYGTTFTITLSNLKRLELFCRTNHYHPAFLFVSNNKKYFFYSLDHQFPTKINKNNTKLEEFPCLT